LAFALSIISFVGPVSAATNAVVPTADAGASGIALSPSTTVAQASTASSIVGKVTSDTGTGIASAVVTIEGAGQRSTVTTDGTGSFTAPVPPGIYTITVNKGGYQTGSTEVTVTPGAAVSVGVSLTTASLSNLNVIGRTATTAAGNSAKFNITSTTVNVLTQEQIRARNTPDLTEVVSELPGITIPHATSNPNQSFVIRGLRYETTTTLDGHPVSSGTSGAFLTNYAASGIFGGVDVFKGGGLIGPGSGESGIGIVNLRTPDYTPKDSGYFQAGLDNYAGSFYTAIADVNLTKDKKLSLIVGKTFTGYRGPTYGLTEPDGYLAVAPPSPYGTFSAPNNISAIVPYIQDFSDTYSLQGELAKIRYKFSDATSLGIEFLGLEGRYDPQGGAYGQFEGYATIAQCLNGSVPGFGSACTVKSTYGNPASAGLIGQSGVPVYAFYPGSDVRQNQPNWNADFKTTIGNDTLLFRPYTAAINRLIDGTQENLVPGDAGNWYQVTNPAYCQANSVTSAAQLATGSAKGPCFASATNPGAAYINPAAAQYPTVYATTSTALNCSVTNPCYTTPTAINNSGQYGYGSPYTTLELDHLFGYTFSYIHPFGANTANFSYDHYYDDATDYINDASPLAAGCSFVYGSSTANLNPSTGLPFQPNCKDAYGNVLQTLRPTPVSVPETFDSRTSVALTGQFQVTPKLEFDAGVYYTKFLINAQQQNPATLTPAYIAANYGGVAGAVPIQPVGIQNAGQHFDPRFGLLFRPTRNLAVRFSAGSSMVIPYASLVSGFLSYSLGSTSSTISTPNYGLAPEEVVQEDLGADFRYSGHGGVFSWDLYNAVVHNPWLSTKIPFCGGPASLGLRPCTLNDFPEPTGEGFTSQTLNGAQQYAQGVEFSFTDEPQFGFGYRFNSSFERNYYLQTPAAYFGNSAQVFYNGAQFASTGSGNTSVPYAKAYAEVQYATRGYSVRFGADYEGNNNSYNAPAFFIFDTGAKINTGFHDVFVSVTGENILNNTFGSLLGRGVEYQGLSPVAGTPSATGYNYSTPFNTAIVSPGPPTWRFSLVKQF
jgi:hypothetical protein